MSDKPIPNTELSFAEMIARMEHVARGFAKGDPVEALVSVVMSALIHTPLIPEDNVYLEGGEVYERARMDAYHAVKVLLPMLDWERFTAVYSMETIKAQRGVAQPRMVLPKIKGIVASLTPIDSIVFAIVNAWIQQPYLLSSQVYDTEFVDMLMEAKAAVEQVIPELDWQWLGELRADLIQQKLDRQERERQGNEWLTRLRTGLEKLRDKPESDSEA